MTLTVTMRTQVLSVTLRCFGFLAKIYLFIWQRQGGAEGEEERIPSRLPAERGAQRGARSQDPEITTCAKS